MKKENIKIGSDIEVFFKDKNTGLYHSAIGLVGGSKQQPKPLEKDGCCVQEDNVALEYNVPPVGLNDAKEMWDNIQYVLNTVKTTMPENLEIECCSSAHFTPDQLNDPKAMEFGCEPDYNAWKDGYPNERPEADPDLRSCGGHIHISFDEADFENCLRLVRILDLYLGVPSVFVDEDTERRKLYGKAGAHRMKYWGTDAGVEYRVLSNWWTKSEESVKWVFSQISKAFDALDEGFDPTDLAEEINEAINNSDKELSAALCDQFKIDVYGEITA